MMVGRVAGTVVSTSKVETLRGSKLLIVRPMDIDTLEIKDDYVICVDDVGAGEGDVVFGAYGSSARQSDTSRRVASDFTVYGIVDHIDIKGRRTYDKAEE
ncbi:MAG: EutN/CcmL family microcompartment protein [Clostridia bacterium]|nr:EutN/CcmL family microcompartment protein [Clostridia bacterium]